MKKTLCAELAYVLGLVLLALGTALMEAANFGMSMIVAPAYVVYLKFSQVWNFFSFGMAEYLLQFVLMLIMSVVLRRFRWRYLLSFATAVIYGLILDGCMAAVGLLPSGHMALRAAEYVAGMLICGMGVAMLFKTYISPEVYELFVKELSMKYSLPIPRVKTAYDLASCALAVALSFVFFGFGRFEGVKWGTVVCALLNGWVIGRCSAWLDKHFEMRDALPLRRYMA